MSNRGAPAIITSERDFLVGRRRVSFGYGGTVGNFNWGAVGKKILVGEEKDIVRIFHEPDDDNFADWYCAVNYTVYNDKLFLVRAIKEAGSSNAGIAIDKDGASSTFTTLKKNEDHEPTITFGTDDKLKFLAKYCGEFGNKISVALATQADFETAKVIDEENNSVDFKRVFEYAPQENEVAIAVLMDDRVVERHMVSLQKGDRNFRGESSYIETYINRRSQYIHVYNNKDQNDIVSFEAVHLAGGAHAAPEASDYVNAFNEFTNADEMELDVLFIGGAITLNNSEIVVQHCLDNIVDQRRDITFVFDISPYKLKGLTKEQMLDEVIDFSSVDVNRNTSYAAYYPDAKYQYDRYNDEWRWMPINGDVGGIYAVGAFFESPAGLNRALIRNCSRLLFNPEEPARDLMYSNNINPVYTVKNVGHAVMGQKTLLSSASIFSRVETRRLFNMMQKMGKDVARFYQFQKNNPTERRRLVSDLEPSYRQLVGLDAIDDYLIVCNESNNPSDVREANEMIADFYVKPNYSAEWIRLNFNATRGTVNFEEIVSSPIA